MFFKLWCEARLPNGQYIQGWPQYRRSKGSRYDWVMMKFESEENNGEEAIIYPRRGLALYEDNEGTPKALVHSVEYKTATTVVRHLGTHALKHITNWSSTKAMENQECTQLKLKAFSM
jgi:hypothetical protein